MSACVLDYSKDLIVADLKKVSLREAWEGEIYKNFRKRHKMSDEDFLEEVTQDWGEGRFIIGAIGEIENRRAKKLLGQEEPQREVNEQTRYDELREQQENARD